jgi:hypothetical protein
MDTNLEVAKEVRLADQNVSSDSEAAEKGSTPTNAYPMSDEDYVVTFKTWIVVWLPVCRMSVHTLITLQVTILSSAYGVSLWLKGANIPAHTVLIILSRFRSGSSQLSQLLEQR